MNLPSDINIVSAAPGGVDEALSILMEASRWLASRGIDQWPMEFMTSKAMRDWMEERAARGEIHFVLAGNDRAGVFALIPELTARDRALWGSLPEDGAYLHSLAVRRAFAGRGLGAEMVRRAGEMTAAAGRRFLRVDCWKESTFLPRWYESMGFARCGEAETNQGRWKLYLYEQQVA